MRKKIFLMCLTFFIFLIGLDTISAKKVCEYISNEDEMFIKLEFSDEEITAYLFDSKLEDYKIKIKDRTSCPKQIYYNYVTNPGIYDSSEGITPEYTLKSNSKKVYCGREEQGRITGIPKKIPELTSTAVTIIQIAVPILLVILGSIDLMKGVTAGKEDEIKKGQQIFIKRLVVAVVIFFVVVIVKFLISIIAETNKDNISDCIDCFISNDCKEDFSYEK